MLPTAIDLERLREVCQRSGSDIDLLYTLAPGARLGWAIEDLAVELEHILGRPVDLVSRRALNARIRDQVLKEARPFYAAA